MFVMSTTRKRKVLSLEQKLSSDHLQLLLVGESKRPRAMIGVQKLPVEFQQKTKKSGKMLLIIDNALCHLSSELLDRENGLFKFKKSGIKRNSCEELSFQDADGDDLVSQLRNVNLKDCCYMIAQAWNSISGSTLRILWNKLLGYNEECVIQSIDCDDDSTAVIEMFKNPDLSQGKVEHLLTVDDTPLFEAVEKR
ncbi:hypothetical protein T10_12453 [Trichinella papuae]|uniref:Jerky-like protein-like n=1 Tax=Trichinella papuae TaxID=268474 RepID=A0A0V1N9D4_9BILA|nr:hypothetical protein T10_12453 [Trichinella papuae]